jgi:hypothetical protein
MVCAAGQTLTGLAVMRELSVWMPADFPPEIGTLP